MLEFKMLQASPHGHRHDKLERARPTPPPPQHTGVAR